MTVDSKRTVVLFFWWSALCCNPEFVTSPRARTLSLKFFWVGTFRDSDLMISTTSLPPKPTKRRRETLAQMITHLHIRIANGWCNEEIV